MLKKIAEFSMQGRWQAAFLIALFSATALILPPLTYIASGVIVLSTLRNGPKEGIIVILASTVLFFLVAGLVLNDYVVSGLFLLSSWLPLFGVTAILGYTRSLAASIKAAAGLGILFVLGVYLTLSDPQLWWQNMMTPFVDVLSQQESWTLTQSQTDAAIYSLSSMMTGLFAAGLTLNLLLGLLLGRAWQAKLYNPGGLRSEFYQLKLGKSAALLMLAVTAISVTSLGDSLGLIRECLPVLLVLFALQGLAIAHAVINQKQKGSFWLVGTYILLIVMMPQMMALLAVIGVVDQWLNFRKDSKE